MRWRTLGRRSRRQLLLALALGLLPAAAGCGSAATSPTTSVTGSPPLTVRTPPANTSTTTAVSAKTATRPTPRRPRADLARLIGQMIVARFRGPTPSAAFLHRVRAGKVGGVILFSDNVAGGTAATRRLTSLLQSTAAKGGNPPLLVMVDQEGGLVKRFPGPPWLAPAQMTSNAVASAQGRATGALLRSAGVNLDLAPVADVESTPNFLGTRSFGSSPRVVGRRACAFAEGLASEHVAYTLKHFPGLGLATGNTDLGAVSIPASADTLRSGYQAYERCGDRPLAVVMVSSASYPDLGVTGPAVMSPVIYQRELRLAVPGAPPLTISDDLEAPAIEAQSGPARQAIDAGLDLLLYAQTEQASAFAYSKLLAEARSGAIATGKVMAANRRIAALKSRFTR
jgi:beta-N-acetylhexosaminidase